MTLDEAKKLLAECQREELQDYAFGDSEVSWIDPKNSCIADGYFGVEVAEVCFLKDGTMFTEDDARNLRELGRLRRADRNDAGQRD